MFEVYEAYKKNNWKAMEYKKHLEAVRELLGPYQSIWNDEVLNSYPHSLKHYPKEWIDALAPLNQQELWQFDGKNNYAPIKGTSLYQLTQNINILTSLPKATHVAENEMPKWAFIKVGSKKKHEILSLLPLIKKLSNHGQIIDIGGGVGHLSRIIAHYCSKDSLCLEQDQELINLGKKRVSKFPIPSGAGNVEFQRAIFGKDDTDKLFNQNSFSIGLHTCGPLAVEHMRSAVRNKEQGILNFGCCYPKITNKDDLNISNLAKNNPLKINEFGLTLTTRSHANITLQEYQLKERVKKFRYHLHLFCYFERDHKKFVSVGNSPLRLYRGDFATYAQTNLERINLTASIDELESFYNDHKINQLVKKMYLANLIRWQFGRLLEHFILTDRALYLEENGLNVSMMEYFDETISPRNIGISAKRACRNTSEDSIIHQE